MAEAALAARLIGAIEHDIIPLTRECVRQGNKIFGAAILRKSDLSTIVAGTNHETENPLWHGEVYTIKSYYEMVAADEARRVDPQDSIFLSTHEPCPMCAAAIAWGGYDTVYYLFSHEESRDAFQIGHDLKILAELFGRGPGEYSRVNAYWSAHSLPRLVGRCPPDARAALQDRLAAIRQTYDEMSALYQASKGNQRNIPLK